MSARLRATILTRIVALSSLFGALAFGLGSMGSAQAADGVVCRFTDERLVEISGMAPSLLHPDVIWVHNDSSGGPRLFAVSTTTCRTLATVTIRGARARDFEAVASGRDARGRAVLWLGDIGDNRDNWPYVEVLRIREPARLVDQVVSARTVQVTYDDRPHNAETLLADPAAPRLWIVTRQLAHGSLYELPRPLKRGQVNIARRVRQEGPLVTDGAVSPDGRRYVLRDYVNATFFSGLPPGREIARIALPLQVQGEAICWAPDGASLLVSSERDNRLIRVALPTGLR